MTAAVNPPAVSILRAEVVPEIGGDTQWTNLQDAYEGPSPAVRSFAEGLRADRERTLSIKRAPSPCRKLFPCAFTPYSGVSAPLQ